jgi:hypothetical protein
MEVEKWLDPAFQEFINKELSTLAKLLGNKVQDLSR